MQLGCLKSLPESKFYFLFRQPYVVVQIQHRFCLYVTQR